VRPAQVAGLRVWRGRCYLVLGGGAEVGPVVGETPDRVRVLEALDTGAWPPLPEPEPDPYAWARSIDPTPKATAHAAGEDSCPTT
jgi:hypothetical protein